MTRHELSPETQRFLDGESGATPRTPEQAAAVRFRDVMDGYARGFREPPADLVDRVMDRLRETRPAGGGLWRWLVAPQAFRVRPVVLALAAALLLVVSQRIAGPAPAVPGAAPASGMVLVRFELLAPEAQTVALAGSFNGWSSEAIALVPGSTPGLWTVTLPLALGSYEYLFVVDGQRWIADPGAHAQVEDGFGQMNSVIVVGPRGIVRS